MAKTTYAGRISTALALAMLGMMIWAVGAGAAIPLSGAKGEPLDGTQAHAPTRFHIHIALGGSEHINNMTTTLPKGLGVNIFTPLCTVPNFEADACAAASKIGTTSVDATVVALPQTVTGRIYFLQPDPGQSLPGLGIILDAATGKVFQRGTSEFEPGTQALETIIKNFPTTVDGAIPLRINSIDITLANTFIKNPSDCKPVVTKFAITSHEDPGTVTHAQTGYTPTGCAPPDIAFHVGRAVRNRLNGTAKLPLRLGAAGKVRLAGAGLKPVSKTVSSPGKLQVPVVPKGKLKQRLASKGKAKTAVRITYVPKGGKARHKTVTVHLVEKPAR